MGRGTLVFKGEKKKKKKSKHSKKGDAAAAVDNKNVAGSSSSSSVVPPVLTKPDHLKPAFSSTESSSSAAEIMPSIRQGTGMITTSGTVVTGHDTQFEKQLQVGDALLVNINGTAQEMRVITMRLSNTSVNLSSGFSSSVKVPTSFSYIPKPRDKHKERQDAAKRQKMVQDDLKQSAFGTYSSQELIYREKTETGSYRIKRDSGTTAQSRSELLHMRSKKTSDKYC